MTPFPESADPTTYEIFDPAMKITDLEDAIQYFNKLILYRLANSKDLAEYKEKMMKRATASLKSMGVDLDISNGVEAMVKDEAEKRARADLGYYAGYFNIETRLRMEQFFGAYHPILGRVSDNPTTEEIFQCGLTGLTLYELRSINGEEQVQDFAFEDI